MARNCNIKKHKDIKTSSIDYASKLNEQQFAAVTSNSGYSLVIAGAGSGKTHTLTYRVAYLLDQGCDPENLLLLTFTNKASKEMLARVKTLIEKDISALWGGTFHSICNRILRRHADQLGFNRSFGIIDSDDQKSLMTKLIKNEKLDLKGRRFPKPDVLLSIHSLAVNTEEKIDSIIDSDYSYLEEWKDAISVLLEKYTKAKQQANVMDFDDLLFMTVVLFSQNPDIAKIYQRKFRHVLVDEYQDTNSLQGKIVNTLVQGNKSLMAVGDDAQSIYSWRGADMEHILAFSEQYPGATIYKIETNYRSTPEILELSNATIKVNTQQYRKELCAQRETGMTPAVVPLGTQRDQADFVSQRIVEVMQEGIGPDEIAVLYRAHFHSMEVQLELTRAGIDYKITSGLRFFEQAHIKDVCAFIRFAVNPKDEVSFLRMVEMIPGIGPKAAANLWNAWRNTEYYSSGIQPRSFSDLFLSLKVPRKSWSIFQQWAYTMDEMLDPSREDGFARPSDMIRSVLQGFYVDYIKVAFDNPEQRHNDLETMLEHATDYPAVEEFLSDLSLLSSVDGQSKEGQHSAAVTLSTIHQAKGLEWKVVFVINLIERMFPSARVLETGDRMQLEEERRLYYVAITRARDQLYLTYPQTNPKSYTGEYYLEPSRFLSECSPEMTEEWIISSW
jgi:DNA helicase II / ATP-dependent DNA helicase PcrA